MWSYWWQCNKWINGLRQPLLFNFVSDKPLGFKVFCQPETLDYKKVDISVWETLTFYLEDDDDSERKVNFNEQTLTFTLQLVKI